MTVDEPKARLKNLFGLSSVDNEKALQVSQSGNALIKVVLGKIIWAVEFRAVCLREWFRSRENSNVETASCWEESSQSFASSEVSSLILSIRPRCFTKAFS